MSGLRVGVDIGGTFTDLCVLDETGVVAVGKVLTTHDEPARAVEAVLVDTLRSAGLSTEDVEQLVHGTTLVTNALIERKGSRTALLATAGFSDVLEMRREHRYELYDLLIELPTPLVPRHLRFDVPERILADGSVDTPLDEDYVERLGRELAERGIEAVAICFLHAFTNPAHERRAAEILREFGLRIAVSSEVVPEIREFERTSTTVANVYVQDLTERYLRDLERRLHRTGVVPPPHIMLSNGGIATVDTAARYPIRILESGPAGGALAAAAFGAASGETDLLAFDMGGTTAKLCTTGFPSGLRSTPTEVIETMAPLIQRERVLRADSGGAGRQRGGLGQSTTMAARGEISWSVNGNIDRTRSPASGVDGGGDGTVGRFGLTHDVDLPGKNRVTLGGSDVVDVVLPGAGGYGDPHERAVEAVLADVVDGYVSIEAARTRYGVEILYVGKAGALVRLPEDYRVDERETLSLRGKGQ